MPPRLLKLMSRSGHQILPPTPAIARIPNHSLSAMVLIAPYKRTISAKKLRPSRSTSAAIRNDCYSARCKVISLEKLDAKPPESCRLFHRWMQLRPKIRLIISKLHSLQPMRPHCHFTSDDHQYNGETTSKTLSLDVNTPVRILWTSRKRFIKPEIPI